MCQRLDFEPCSANANEKKMGEAFVDETRGGGRREGRRRASQEKAIFKLHPPLLLRSKRTARRVREMMMVAAKAKAKAMTAASAMVKVLESERVEREREEEKERERRRDEKMMTAVLLATSVNHSYVSSTALLQPRDLQRRPGDIITIVIVKIGVRPTARLTAEATKLIITETGSHRMAAGWPAGAGTGV